MANYRIRKYEDKDCEVVRDIFAVGIREHIPAGFVYTLKQPRLHLTLMCVLCLLFLSSRSFMLCILAVVLLLAGLRQASDYIYSTYVEATLKDDLLDINKTYMKSKGSCFWVAESNDHVVAIVAAVPSKGEPGALELRRMSVRKNYRGLGIAKALCRTVLDFARANGYKAVVLETSQVQYDAQKLYESIGYKKIRQFVLPMLVAKIINFSILTYRYDFFPHN
ncbi:probable N-acetyltransferase camello [Acipenser ruthenus]|uniref:probable N-acetyltransferase camello n=1 Tax=Acipenser ruthenus TaxID=7906 RepID=UPI00145BC2B8|nr:probable N-acetyltransferase camello [Acipenser ruthenus]XP_058889867.1 probable N-acetyltransferase camello [Acipenser ruthenus]XP_058889871.1 probable N-acetyltransferase camello [Acipenser ruthenus]